MNIQTLSIDLETRSSADLSRAGVYRYAESPDFDILLFGCAVNGGEVKVYDLASGETLPPEILAALTDPTVEKWAYNCSFERVCLSVWLRRNAPAFFRGYGFADDPTCGYLDPSSWRCSMVWAAYLGLPFGLNRVGAVLRLEEQKLQSGRELIPLFCTPCDDEGRRWNGPRDYPAKWAEFKAYNARDVEVEMQIQDRLRNRPVPEWLWEQYRLDQEINDRGIRIDRELVRQAIAMNRTAAEALTRRMREITRLENPNSVAQLKQYLGERGLAVESLDKKTAAALMKTAPADLAELLDLRLKLAKSSVKKYEAMEASVCADGRCHGMFQFYGANRTGRWAGRLIQLQNLPQNHLPDLEEARGLVKAGDLETLTRLYGSAPAVLSELVRTAFVPQPGCKFIVADFAAIEARVLSHLAGELWRQKVFRDGGDIYCASASRMFRVPVEKHGVNAHLRQKGKIAELALGYGGSVGALKAMGALELGLKEEELLPLVTMWREANPNIVAYWWAVDEAVKTAVRGRSVSSVGPVRFRCNGSMLYAKLPSGRCLSYVHPRITYNSQNRESVSYCGLTPRKTWDRIETWGPKIVENLTQAISRDILAEAMKRLSFCRIVGHVHDEVILEAGQDMSVEAVCGIMGRSPEWLPGIDLRADGYECPYYRKDN